MKTKRKTHKHKWFDRSIAWDYFVRTCTECGKEQHYQARDDIYLRLETGGRVQP